MNLKKIGKSAKPLFLGMSSREKILFLLILVVGAGFWALSLSGRFDQFSSHLKGLWAIDQNQRATLDEKEITEIAFAASLGNLDVEVLPNQNEVFGKIDTLITQFGMEYKLDAPKRKVRDALSFNTYSLKINKTEYDTLMKFTQAVSDQFPYVNLDDLQIVPDRRNPRLLDARMRLSAIEFKK
jgi:hypothetical protein